MNTLTRPVPGPNLPPNPVPTDPNPWQPSIVRQLAGVVAGVGVILAVAWMAAELAVAIRWGW